MRLPRLVHSGSRVGPAKGSGGGAVWVVLVGVFLTFAYAGTARAACGYYVVAERPAQGMVGGQGMRPMSHADDAPADCPCRGPQCHAGQPTSAPVAAVPQATDHQSACCQGVERWGEGAVQFVVPSRSPVPSAVYLPTTEPPPRAA